MSNHPQHENHSAHMPQQFVQMTVPSAAVVQNTSEQRSVVPVPRSHQASVEQQEQQVSHMELDPRNM